MKKMHHNPKLYFLYDPKGHFTNAQTLYYSIKRQVNEIYYGRKKSQDEKNPFKGTVFEKCELPYEIFNVNRMAKNNSKQMLSRLGFLTLRDGSIELAQKNRPELPELKSILRSLERDYNLGNFDKPDYFTPFPFLEGAISFENMRT